MNAKGRTLAALIFLAVSLAHIARLILRIEVRLDDLEIPMWISIAGTVVPAVIAWLLLREVGQKPDVVATTTVGRFRAAARTERPGGRIAAYFSEDDLNAVSAAVREAESRTSGEIVPCIVDESDAYEEAMWRAGLTVMVMSLGILVMARAADTWPHSDMVTSSLVALLLGAGSALLVRMIPALRRFCAGKDLMEQRVAMRAFEAFVTEEVFNTRDRTGVLIFISLLEHEVLVIGDSGVNARVRENDWNDIVRRIVMGLRSHSATHGLTEAIRMTGDLLVERGFQRRSDDRNELDDRPREGWGK